MIDLCRDPGLSRHGEQLVHRFEDAVPLVAYVRDVQAATFGDNPGQRDQLFCLGITGRRIDECRGKAECTFFHRLADQPAHPVKLV
jgi:hypothetical protein